jgi:hypothetical protein
MTKVEIEFPFYQKVEDYHEFSDIKSLLSSLAGINVCYEEVDLAEDQVELNYKIHGCGSYAALFYIKALQNN